MVRQTLDSRLRGNDVYCRCSSLSPEARESLSDIRGLLPEFKRSDAVPLEEKLMPTLSGSWKEYDFPELGLKLRQTGNTGTECV